MLQGSPEFDFYLEKFLNFKYQLNWNRVVPIWFVIEWNVIVFIFYSENIFGYKDLRIDVFCTAAKMITYVNIKYTDKITPERFDGVTVSKYLD